MSDFEPRIRHAIRVIESTYGDRVSVDIKNKDLLKFGRNEDVDTGAYETLMTLAGSETDETYVSDNTITHFASSSASDTVTMTVEGHTLSGGNFTFASENITLAGQTKTALATPLARVTRAYNTGSTDLVGSVYFAEDVTFTAGVPQTASAVHLIVPAGQNQSFKASTTLSQFDYWIVTNCFASVLAKTAGKADVQLEVREQGGVFRARTPFSCSDAHQGLVEFDPYLIVPANADIRLRAKASANNTDVSGGIQGYLAIKVEG